MGTMTSLTLDGFHIVSSKNAVIPEVMSIFREADRRNYLSSTDPSDEMVDSRTADDLEDPYRVIEYATSARFAIQRLEVMGFTWQRVRSDYEATRASLIQTSEGYLADARARPGSFDMVPIYECELGLFRGMSFEVYIAAFREVFLNRHQWYLIKDSDLKGLDQFQQYLLDDQHDDWPLFGFFCTDLRCFIRAALSVANPEAIVAQPIEGLIESGWLDEATPICDECIALLVEKYPENAPRIILTEGSSDVEILKTSLQVLFPHMVGYYTFFDFHGARAAGGASQLIAVVKAFAASGVGNRVIALLDNDTAGREAQRGLKDVKLPKNLAVLHYPERDWLLSYPTLGPSGEEWLNVNGTAASIELYLGADALRLEGRLCPVQWAGYSSTMKAYQGEVLSKDRIRQAWSEKAARCLAEPALVIPADWADLKAIWQAIFDTFSDA
jgi:hypothetical protein